MLFYPIRFAGWRLPGLSRLAPLLPRRIQQVPGVMQGGVGWQGIIPSRAAKMGSIAVDKGIAKLGSPADFYNQLEPEAIAEHICNTASEDIREVVDRIMEREYPDALAEHAEARSRRRPRPGPAAAPRHRPHGHRRDRRPHRPAARHQADGDPPDRGEPGAGKPDLPRGRSQGAPPHHQLRLLLRRAARRAARLPDERLPALVGAADRRRDHRLGHQLGGALDDLRAGRTEADRPPQAARPVHPPPTRGIRGLWRGHRGRHRHPQQHRRRAPARAELRSHPPDDRGRHAARRRPRRRPRPAGGPGRNRARASTRPSASRSPPRPSTTR